MKHRTTLFISGLAIVLLLAMAAAIEDMQFTEGYRINLDAIDSGTTGGAGFSISERVFVGFTSTMMLLSLVFTVVSLFTSEGRRRVLTYAVFSAALALVFALLLELVPDEAEEIPFREAQEAPGAGGIPGADDGGGIVPDIPEEADERAVWATVAAAALAAGAVAYGLYRGHRGRWEPEMSEEAAAAAQNAGAELTHGAEPGDVIIRTYMELERIAAKQLSITRETALTPREFTERLAAHGVPQEPLESLVSLFEQVRYGEAESTEHMRDTARETLKQIAAGTRPTGRDPADRERNG